MNSQEFKKIKLPNKPGVYFFKKGKKIIYIGKATSLKDRTKSYFAKDLIVTRGPLILDMVVQSNSLEYEETSNVLEALILEANLIKKYKPKYNTKEKDNKSFNYVCINKDIIPKVLIVRGRGLDKKKYKKIYGPFTNGIQLKEAMKIIRRIFPYIDKDSIKKNNIKFYKQLGLIPYVNVKNLENTFLKEYKNNIKNLKLFFEGKKKKIIINLKKEMSLYAKKKEFEKAGEIKKKIFALQHINDIALIKEEKFESLTPEYFRIEAYDIAHLGGKNMVGAMTVIENREVNKSEYKKFIVNTQNKANDTGALFEVLSRRFRHREWGIPNLIVMDGSIAQINIAKKILDGYRLNILVVGVVKDKKHKPKVIMGSGKIIKKYKKEILLANNEAHRFAITFHKQKRKKEFLE